MPFLEQLAEASRNKSKALRESTKERKIISVRIPESDTGKMAKIGVLHWMENVMNACGGVLLDLTPFACI